MAVRCERSNLEGAPFDSNSYGTRGGRDAKKPPAKPDHTGGPAGGLFVLRELLRQLGELLSLLGELMALIKKTSLRSRPPKIYEFQSIKRCNTTLSLREDSLREEGFL